MTAGRGRGISALIISPTRELALQIATEATSLGKFHNINVQVSTHLDKALLHCMLGSKSQLQLHIPKLHCLIVVLTTPSFMLCQMVPCPCIVIPASMLTCHNVDLP